MFKLYTTKEKFTSYSVDRNWSLAGEFKTVKAMNAAAEKLPQGTFYKGFNRDGLEMEWDNFSGFVLNAYVW